MYHEILILRGDKDMAKFDELPPGQQKAILLLTQQIIDPDAPKMTYEQIADEVGVDRRTLFLWRTQNKAFIEAKRELVDRYADEIVADAFSALRYQLKNKKNVRAAEVLLKSRGMLVDKQEVRIEKSAEEDQEAVNRLKQMLNPTVAKDTNHNE